MQKFLKENNIPFEREKSFEDCILDSNHKARFDFYIDNKYLIEYDGEQHFHSGSGWNTEEKVKVTQESDRIKNQWCKNNNISLIRISYTHKKITLNDLLLETTTFLINEKE